MSVLDKRPIGSSKRESLSDRAYEIIKRKIVTLELDPGSVIDETELRNSLALGRTPIREALKRLSLEKLVVIVPRRGMFVTDIGITDLQRLFEVRKELEALAARLAADRGNSTHWDAMAEWLDSVDEQQADNHQALLDIDEACHYIMYAAADNAFLYDTLSMLYALSLRLWHFSLKDLGDMQTAVFEHRLILEALQAGDAENASDLLHQHIVGFQNAIRDVMLDQAS